jgi:hypothetical protein
VKEMASIFSITTTTSNIQIKAQRSATITFTVTNTSGQPLTGRAVLVMDPPNEAQAVWLQLESPEESESHFEVNGIQDYIVEVNVPVEAAPGEYVFHLDMLDTENPDETYTVGPAVTLQVAAPPPPPKEKKPFPWQIIAVGLGILAVIIGAVIFWPRPPHVILHTVTSSSLHGHWTEIDDARTNNNPKAILLVTPNWNPSGQGEVYNNHSIGLWYTGSRWAIFNQDLASMPQGASFNVQILNAGRNAFVHTATSSSIHSNWTEIDNARTNNNPEAIVLVASNWNPPGQSGVYNNHPIGVWYTGSRWAIFNQDGAGIPQGASFNVQILNAGTDAFVHRATTSNIAGDYTQIDHARTNNNPEAIIFVTPNLSPPGMGGGVYLNHSIGVWYTGSRWAIFNQDIAIMTQGPAFNVLILDLR